ncbi:MAG: TIGR03013 family PEP-CTERM/XrtA system glycosyltransferase, partial [Desulfobacteraceae bacterium]|nr:TIGR03013 family PEP-CTERM/XrtA system glycosyltransferase [Desulfobacteraceae bacterium]
YYNDLYDFDRVKTLPEMIIRLLQSLGAVCIILGLVYLIFPLAEIDQKVFTLSLVFLIIFITSWRLVYLKILKKGYFNENIIIVGSSELSIAILNKIQDTIDCGYRIKAIFPDPDDDTKKKINSKDIFFMYNISMLRKIAVSGGVKKIVTVIKEQRGSFPMKELIECRTIGIEIIDGCSFYEHLAGKVLSNRINPSWLVFSEGFKKSGLRIFLKRVEDIIGSLIALIILSPILAVTAVLIKISSKGPVLFAQDRMGRHKKEFLMYKFRSMVNDAEKLTGPVWADDDDPRITMVGKIIRKYRIDELPQFWDVLMGRMSLVGPRPERKYFTDQLEEQIQFYSQRFIAKPGITGWAQVSYDYGATVEDAIEKLNYDLFYIKNMTLLFDLIIILRTIKIVIFGRGAR